VSGRIIAGELVRKACERHLRDLADGPERGLRFDVKAADRAIAFFPLLRHYKGELGPQPPRKPLGDPIRLEPWQKFVIGSLFGWMRADGTRRFRALYLEVAKKNGKTTIAAGIALLLAFFDGEPGAQVYVVATKREQAKICWNDGRQMVMANPDLKRRLATLALTISDLRTASYFRPLGRDSDTGEQGIDVHGAIVDELHVLEDRDSIDNIETATSARRQPMVVKITTAGKKRESVWADERADAISVAEGRATDDSMLVLVYCLDHDADGNLVDDPFDEAVWPKANPNLGVSVNVATLREQAAIARRSPAKLAAYLQLRMNVPTAIGTRALNIEEWDACSGLATVTDPDGLERLEAYDEWEERTFGTSRTGFGGLDLASVRDLTALVFVSRAADGAIDVRARFWCPEEGIEQRSRVDGVPYADWVRDGFLIATPGNVTDYDYVQAEAGELAGVHEVTEIGFDRWNATQLATDLTSEGATLVAIPQTHAGLGPAWRELDKAVLERKIRHGGHPILRWMAGNVEVETDASGNQKPSKRLSKERIDGIVALDMAIARLMAHGEVEEVEPWAIVR
jgi:phage terminase large subunit-like protein